MRTITNHIADRDELNRLLDQYEQISDEFQRSLEHATIYYNRASAAVSGTIAWGDITVSEAAEAHENIQLIRTFWDGMVEADLTAKSWFSDSQAGISVLSSTLQTLLAAIGKNGGNIESIDVQQLRSSIYNDQAIFKYITDKMSSGEQLTYEERGLFYHYIQDEVFGDGAVDEYLEVAKMMVDTSNEDGDYTNIEGVVNRINEDVLASDNSLANEITMLELLLFTGNERPDNHIINGTDAANLSAYLTMLRNYQKHIYEAGDYLRHDRKPDDPLLARVEYVNYSVSEEPFKIQLDSELTVSYSEENDGFTREEFLAVEEYFGGNYVANPQIEYYYGRQAVNDLQYAENLQMEDELASYRSDFIGEQAMKTLIKNVTRSSPFTGPTLTLIDHHQGRRELEDNITVGEAKSVAINLDMELQLTTDRIVGDKEFEIQLNPTDSTYNILNKWIEVESMGADIPFPTEGEIEHQDWRAISDFLNKNRSEFMNSNEDIYYYIVDGDLEEGMTVDDLIYK